MRLTTRTNLALRTLMFCAVNPDRNVRKSEIAALCNASENHLALIVHKLQLKGFVTTIRGRNGGIRLSRAAKAITVGAVCRTLEGATPFTECFPGGEMSCPLMCDCRLRPIFADALEQFYATLDRVTIADLTEGNAGLHALLRLEPV